ncbi:otoferlin-like [Cydia pomonella]|uniref:otoferlin-like n=1 Tax=Cydia pomonella TaxID=82600 RepID=UPI002ADDAF6F|nr:otoferlin-like [Cydia pomonella]
MPAFSNLLLLYGSEQQPACYQVTIYRAYNVPCSAHTRPDILGNPPSTCVRLTFCDLMGVTSPQHRTNNPVYVERVSLVEMFPNVCDTIQLEVCSVNVGSKVLASTRLKLSEISHGGENGFLPTFGPSLLHMYGPWRESDDGPYHRGALLVAMKTIVPYYKRGLRTAHVEPVNAGSLDTVRSDEQVAREWIIENFIMFCPVFEVSMLDKSLSEASCGIAITAGEIPFNSSFDQGKYTKYCTTFDTIIGFVNFIFYFVFTDSDEFEKKMSEIKQKKLHYTGGRPVRWNSHVSGHLELTCPVLQLAARLPDLRLRVYVDNVLQGIYADLVRNLLSRTEAANELSLYGEPVTLRRPLSSSFQENDIWEISSRLTNNDYMYPNDLLESLHRSNDEIAAQVKKFLEIVQYSSLNEDMQKCTTELDRKLVQLQKEKMEKIYSRLISRKTKAHHSPYCRKPLFLEQIESKKTVKIMLAEAKSVLQELKELMYKTPDGWPHISVWLLSNGSRVAHAKITPGDIIHSVTPEQSGRQCGKIQTVYLKPIKCSHHHPLECHCIYGKVELLAWMGSFSHRAMFQYCIPDGYRSTESGLTLECEPIFLECCVNVYRAKLSGSSDLSGLSPFVRIHFMNNVKDTQICQNTALPVWSEVLRISCSAYVSPQRLETSPPEILVEVYHWDTTQKVTPEPLYLQLDLYNNIQYHLPGTLHSYLHMGDTVTGVKILYHMPPFKSYVFSQGKIDLLGRVTITPVFLIAQDLESPPALDWLDLHLGTEDVGKIQMSAQLLQTNENVLSKAWINRTQELLQRSSDQVLRTALTSDVPEPLPLHILPANMSYKIDVYFWGLREVGITNKPLVTLELEDITIKSAIISQCKSNCNFPNARISQTFQGNLTNGSQLTIKLFDTTTFGRTLFVGSNVKNPQKYLLTFLSKSERDEKLFLKPVVNNFFVQVNRKTFVKKSLTYPVFENPKSYKNEEEKNPKVKWEKMKKIFFKKACEEEIMLLPIYSKERDNVVKETEDDWWTRYYSSLNVNTFVNIYKFNLPAYEADGPGFKSGKGIHLCDENEYLFLSHGLMGAFYVYKYLYIIYIEKSSGDRELATNRITIYDSELEEQPDFTKFKDWCGTIKIYNSSKTGIPDKDEKLRCGHLKASVAIYQWPPPADTVAVSSSGVDLEQGYFDNHPDNEPARYLVRIYAVKCSRLVTKGITSRCYVAVQCNSKTLSDRESSVPRDAEPTFGKMYELDCTLPEDYLLKISVLDCGAAGDELIGCTSIDLEDRAYTKYRATVGLASEYNINGPNRWRDSDRPSAILEQLCEKNHLPAPEFPDPSSLVLNGVEYKDLDSAAHRHSRSHSASKENLCLNILHKWHTIPVCGHRLVPEHVEIRTLYDPEKPGTEQGKIHMWMDMFPLDSRRAIPSPVSIRPRPDENYELRVVVWDVQGLKLNKGANIYVRASLLCLETLLSLFVFILNALLPLRYFYRIEGNCHKVTLFCRWIGPSDEAQDTDIYTSTNGEGRFSWRMIFQFQYKHTERKLVLYDKGPFTEVTELFPPILVVQVLDIDAPTLQDFIGTESVISILPSVRSYKAVSQKQMNLEVNLLVTFCYRLVERTDEKMQKRMLTLDLSGMPRGSRLPHSAHAVTHMRKVNMFSVRNVRGWWPLRMVDRNSGNYYFAGIIELEIALLPQQKALLMPVGLGRDPPVPLPDPIHQPHVSRSKYHTSLVQCGPTTRLLVALGFILLGFCIYWQLPVIVVSFIPTMNT